MLIRGFGGPAVLNGSVYDGEGGAGGGAGTGGSGTGADLSGAAWYAGKVDQETVGHWQNRGWNVADPVAVSTAATKAWRDAEAAAQALHGVPADRLLRLPAQGDDAGLKAFQQKLGAPVDVTGYDFSGVKHANGEVVEAAFAANLAATYHKLGIPKDAAAEITRSIVGLADNADTAETAETGAKLAAEQQTLRTNWGVNFEANKFVASQAAVKLGITPVELDMLDGQIGHARVMEMFRKIGTQLGEAQFVSAGGNATPGIMTQEQAVARIADLKKDPIWTKKYLDGDTAARNEMAALSRMKLGPIDESQRPRRYAR